MGSSETGPKAFDRGAEIIPLKAPGISTLAEFQAREKDIQHLEHLKYCGLTDDEIQLYYEAQTGTERRKMEKCALREKLQNIYIKLDAKKAHEHSFESEISHEATPSTSANIDRPFSTAPQYYPNSHPMNNIKEIEKDLFDHTRFDKMATITQRRKMLRRLHRKEQSLTCDGSKNSGEVVSTLSRSSELNSLWDVREVPKRAHNSNTVRIQTSPEIEDRNRQAECTKRIIGPKPQTHYTIRDNKIVRLEPVESGSSQDYRAVEIVTPKNQAEQRLLEGTKLSVDQIRTVERFKDYLPGEPSKVLFLKNISPAVRQEDISVLLSPVASDVARARLLTGRLRGQAFVHFHSESAAIKALAVVNGTVVKGRPIIAQFGKHCDNT